jgi:proteasome beta subunit
MTTTLGLVCKDGVVLASDRQSTMGNLISSKTAKKIHQIDDRMAITTAGCVGDIRALVRLASVHAQDYKIRRHRSITIRAMATFLSNVLNAHKMLPYEVQILIGGINVDGTPRIYSVDAYGGTAEEGDVTATGTGSPFAYGVLDNKYKKNISMEEAMKIAEDAVKSAIGRDSYSGQAIRVVAITKDEYSVKDIKI